MKSIRLLTLLALLATPGRAQYLSTNPPVSASEITVYVTNVDYLYLDGFYTNTFNGTNWPAGIFYSVSAGASYYNLQWATNGVWWLSTGDCSYSMSGGPTNFAGTYTP